ncbi:acetate CoA-transferase subunit alpha [Propionivibrio dicarboxylicus]|uniref:Acetate CoA/acetoacetate CoA-transferase alpha subunit n=1 Tax=Propionivibrio dicarboxylicus TaxID=83767 RepID=A0A1G8J4F3_9RHOO|nr:acetate CoA-transferase subunit alpha [Propionivibrio dicarboxylicus]SDI25971.1 acetate CoA/acetoacetate CoA-transferase alpha subunit [Propionivibrio dicarboxylicus]
MDKIIGINEVVQHFKDGMTVLYGGFMGVGTPAGLVKCLLDSGACKLTLVGNDTAFPDTGVGPLIVKKRVGKLVTSHIGTNPETGRQMIAGELEVELVPQGSLAERVRCGGAGLGGVLTPTGVGTIVEEGKTKLCFDGKEYLVERPIRGDIALIKARKADRSGNLVYERAARNFNPLMALAADLVVVEADELVDVGELDPECIVTPGVVVHKIVVTGGL